MTRFEVNSIVMPLYMDSAETYLQLAIGAIGLTIAFREKILGEDSTRSLSKSLVMTWVLFLLAIGFSAIYQWAAVRFLDSHSNYPQPIEDYLKWIVQSPARAYYAMVLCFFLGAIFLVFSTARQLLKKDRNLFTPPS